MKEIKKRDKVILPDGTLGQTIEVYASKMGTVYKVRKQGSEGTQYFEEGQIKLKSQHIQNFLMGLFNPKEK